MRFRPSSLSRPRPVTAPLTKAPRMPPLHRPRLSRRQALLGIGAAAGTAGIPAGLLRDGEADDLAAFGRLAGLEFRSEDRQQAETTLRRRRRDYELLRTLETPFGLAPAERFDPLLPTTPMPLAGGGVAWRPTRELPPPQDDLELAFAEISELATWLRSGHVTSRRLTELCLSRLARFQDTLFCVVTLLREEALAAADRCDAALAAGQAPDSPLFGIPYGAKDLLAWPGAPTTFGAAPFRDHHWELRATVLDRLHAAGAVLVAKLSLGALAMGDLWFGGRTRTPWNPERGSSGSSAGSASAVAAGLIPFALGSETLGSIVSPCTRCGVGGLRPTFGAVSRHGAMPLSWTMDKIGPIARSALDLAIVFDTIRGADGHDPCARDAAFAFDPERGLRGLRVGVVRGGRGLQRAEDQAFLDWLQAQGCRISDATLPDAPYGALLLGLHAESATVFDDLLRQDLLDQLPGQADNDWPNSFRSSRAIPAVEMLRSSRLRRQLCVDMAAATASLDLIVAPTHGGPTLTCTNLTGHPQAVIPVGAAAGEDATPTMITLVGNLYDEATPLTVAHRWQRTTQWHRRRPETTNR
jgi:Asp-tRNA(Asn)/Glu-tRNA(Gln) amidotransferase A subunit family amidase